MKIIMINQIIQYFFIVLYIILLIFYGFVVYAARRAARQTGIPIPVVWVGIMIIAFFIILTSLTFIVFIRP